MNPIRSNLLRAVIGLDALVCGALGTVLVGADAIAASAGLSRAFADPLALFLIGYAVLLVWMALRPQLPRSAVWALAAFNAAWALESMLAVALAWVTPAPAGQVVIGLQAAGALGVSALQVLALRQAGRLVS